MEKLARERLQRSKLSCEIFVVRPLTSLVNSPAESRASDVRGAILTHVWAISEQTMLFTPWQCPPYPFSGHSTLPQFLCLEVRDCPFCELWASLAGPSVEQAVGRYTDITCSWKVDVQVVSCASRYKPGDDWTGQGPSSARIMESQSLGLRLENLT